MIEINVSNGMIRESDSSLIMILKRKRESFKMIGDNGSTVEFICVGNTGWYITLESDVLSYRHTAKELCVYRMFNILCINDFKIKIIPDGEESIYTNTGFSVEE